MKYKITKEQARRFLLLKHGLLGDYVYSDKQDIVSFIQNVCCLQYDPVDVVGKNAEIILNSRFEEFKKEYLDAALYHDRSLIEYWDKNMSIILAEDYKYFGRIKDKFKKEIRGIEEIEKLAPIMIEKLEEVEYLCSQDIDLGGKMDWYWYNSRKSKAVLEALFHQGRVVIHHRKGANRYFTLLYKLLSKDIYTDLEFASDLDYYAFRVYRRIKGVGLLAPNNSYAYIAIDNLNIKLKKQVFEKLLSEDKIIKVDIEDLGTYYLVSEDIKYLEEALSDKKFLERLEFIAPLDNLIWDRDFIKKLFNFDYIWEIYMPKEKRKYGYYVLPILYGTRFIGRIEAIANRKSKTLEVKNIYLEENIKQTLKLKEKMHSSITRLMKFNNLEIIDYLDKSWEK